MSGFDPIVSARAVREQRLYPPRARDLAAYGEHGLWRAGAEALKVVTEGWWLGAPDHQGKPWGDPPAYYEAEHRHARALAAWMAERDDAALWKDAAAAYRRCLTDAPDSTDARTRTAFDLCSAMAGEGGAPADMPRRLSELFEAAGPGVDATTLSALQFGRVAGLASPELAVLSSYVVMPRLPLPPALAARGWSDRDSAAASVGSLSFPAVDAIVTACGMERDPDGAPQPNPPLLATWTRHPALDLEADWRGDAGIVMLEIRGIGAGRLAAVLAAAGGAQLLPSPEAALVDLLTVPSTARDQSNAALRWAALAAVLATPEAAPDATAALVAAGLVDPDWRVRMLALWGVGALRLGTLADRARRTPLPPLSFEGVNQDDRHTLLALRDAAAQRAGGGVPDPPTNDGAGPGGRRRAAFVARINGLFDAGSLDPGDRHAALIAVLRRWPGLDAKRLPKAWRGWMC
jgi:hypothetical protein